ncbi:MAG TPA: hypothetical protein VM124_03065 [Candidatus Limnocylindrales bacterium]|nr:hypothetical protein [Candidatus Limnocylindrales bacterium]
MTPDIILGAVVVIPALMLMLLRVNATLVFLSLCLGSVLVQFVAKDVASLLSLFSAQAPHSVAVAGNNTKLILLLAPVILTAIFMIRTVRGNGRLLLNVLPAAGVGLLGALLVVPLLPPGTSHNIVISPLWHQVQNAQSTIVGASAVVCLLVLWLQRPTTGSNKHKKHKG